MLWAREFAVKTVVCDHWARGGAGAEGLAHVVAALADAGEAEFRLLYGDEMSLWDKTRTIAQEIYGAADIAAEASVRAKFRELEFGRLGPPAGMRRQDPIFVLGRSYSHRRAKRSRSKDPRRPSPRGRRLRRRADGGRPNDAGIAAHSRRREEFALSTARSMVSLKRPDSTLNAAVARPRAAASEPLALATTQPAALRSSLQRSV